MLNFLFSVFSRADAPILLLMFRGFTTPDLHITVGLIIVGFVRTGSDVPSMSVMSLKMKKMIGAGLKPAVKDHITVGLWLEPAVFWRPLITASLSQEPTVIVLYHYRF